MIAAVLNSPFHFGAPPSPPPGGDPYFANVVLLAHMNGTNGGTTFTDSSSSAHAITAFGNAQTSTAQSKFNGSSGLFDGAGDYLTLGASTDFDFGTGDFTIEWFCRFSSVANYQYFFDIGSNGTCIRILNGTSLQVWFTGQFTTTAITTLSTGQWYHMAWTRTGTAWNFWVDGTSVASGTTSRAAGSSVASVKIGSFGGGGFNFAGNMAEFRVTGAVNRYPSSFSPPLSAFPDS